MSSSLASRLLRGFVDLNFRVSRLQTRLISRIVPRRSGLTDFCQRVMPSLLRPGLRVLEVGGGKAPLLGADRVRELGLHMTGLDISADELAKRPPGSYHQVVVGDVSRVALPQQFDLIFSRAVIEHVADARGAMENLTTALADGGVMAHFIPCRNAPYAILNRLLGNRLVRRMLFCIYPERRAVAGFRAYYDDCVPTRFDRLCRRYGLEVVEITPYFCSDYFECFAPAHTLDLCRQAILQGLRARNLAETFVVVARKPMPVASSHDLIDPKAA